MRSGSTELVVASDFDTLLLYRDNIFCCSDMHVLVPVVLSSSPTVQQVFYSLDFDVISSVYRPSGSRD